VGSSVVVIRSQAAHPCASAPSRATSAAGFASRLRLWRRSRREPPTFAVVRRRSANIPGGKRESGGALLRRIRFGLLGHQWERSQKFTRINCVTATNQLAGSEPATFDRLIDSRFGDPCGSCRTAWCVHRLTSELRLFSCSHALVKERLRYAAEQRREVGLTHRGAAEATHHPGEARLAKTFRIQPDSFAIYRDRRISLAASAQSVESSG
jgi:hypothetical protein